MSFELYLAFIAAAVILMVIPGPNVPSIVANSAAHGTGFGLLTVARAIAVLNFLPASFDWLRWTPQFITPGAAAADQLLLLAVTFLAVAIVSDHGWAILGGLLRALLVARTWLRNRLTGGLLAGAGVGLALARLP
jgi:threonine/homoserine/homoserine lactone efflux protein